MPRTYKICSPRIAGLGEAKTKASASSAQTATSERVDNLRVIPFSGNVDRMRAAVETLKLWDNGRTLRVRFTDGDQSVQQKVEDIAKEWEQVSNLTLKFVRSGAAEIRISFADEGFSWSTVGTDARTVPSTQPTMNYGWLKTNTSTREYQRVVRHEFGHALGMIHEHQNPAAVGQIPWDKPKVYAYYAQQGWTAADVDFNIFQLYSEDSTNHTEFDPTSIMAYAIPDSLTVGSYSIGWNTALSTIDHQFMSRQYPKGSPGVLELEPGGPRIEADLAASGEVDTYHFETTTPATHIMTTQGPSDTVLTLHGPDDPGAVLAWDDDLGKGANARIVRKLGAAEYWLTVRHKDPDALGVYSVGITTRKSR